MFSFVKHLKTNNNVSLKIPSFRTRKLVSTSREKFFKAKKNYREGIISRIKNGSFSESVTEERIRQIKNDLKNNNNHLEVEL
ncbi:hypothetical protein AR685_04280 [Chryseobacterium sp. JAH]|nr:hypothetical protein AR685_04280 [Chryseobacterium sp. JAH]